MDVVDAIRKRRAVRSYTVPAGGAWTSWGQSSDPGRRFAYGAAGDPGGERRLCPTCGAQAGPNDVYCPQCGKSM